jgi:ubiquinone/menaquinone biosynthesis C-methylase UbiE
VTARHIRLRELLLGVEGLALLRHLLGGSDEHAAARVDEMRRIFSDAEDATFGLGSDVPELDVRAGYTVWSQTYDRPGNPLISVEQPVVWALVEALPRGRALDAACGTGRHTRHLADLGHDVLGVDTTPAMLERASTAVPAVPGARFALGDLAALPARTGSCDLVVCALALDHVQEVAGPIVELARVVRPGGRVVISDVHPAAWVIGGAAFFRGADGANAFMRNHGHLHSEYLRAFAAAGLTVRDCVEPRFGPAEVAMQGLASSFFPEAATSAYLGLPGALVWDLERKARERSRNTS